MSEEQQPDRGDDPEPLKHVDAERVTDEAERVPSDEEADEGADQASAERA